jgi:AcrR family transcriptional regulator
LVALSGSGAGNTLVLFGSQALNGTERYDASTTAAGGVGNTLFTATNAVPSVTDDLIATQLVVEAPGQAVSLAGPNGLTETLKGLAGRSGGGNNLTCRGQGEVRLELNSANAVANLSVSRAARRINRPSLYAAFGNKEQLFRKALDRYQTGPQSVLAEALKAPTARAVAEVMFSGFVGMLRGWDKERRFLIVPGGAGVRRGGRAGSPGGGPVKPGGGNCITGAVRAGRAGWRPAGRVRLRDTRAVRRHGRERLGGAGGQRGDGEGVAARFGDGNASMALLAHSNIRSLRPPTSWWLRASVSSTCSRNRKSAACEGPTRYVSLFRDTLGKWGRQK